METNRSLKFLAGFWIFFFQIIIVTGQIEQEENSLQYENSQTITESRSELKKYAETLDAHIATIKEDLIKLELEILRAAGDINREMRKDTIPEPETNLEGIDSVEFENNTGENTEIDTIFFQEEVKPDSQRIRELEEQRRNLKNLSQRLYFLSKTLKEAIQVGDYREAERLKIRTEDLIDEIDEGIYSIRDEIMKMREG